MVHTPRLGLVQQRVQDADARRDKDLVARSLQHVQGLGVGEARVVDQADAVAQRLLDAGAGAGVHDDALAAHAHLLGAGGHLGVGHPGGLGIGPGDEVVARQVQLDRIHTVLQEHARDLSQVFRAIDHHAEAELRKGQVRQHLVAQATGHGDLLAGRQVPGTRDLPGLDGVADHHVQARLGAGSAQTRGETGLEVVVRHLGRPQHVLLQRHGLNAGQRGRVVPGEVGVGLGHARHQRGACRIHDQRVTGRDTTRAAAHGHDAVAAHAHAAGVRHLPAAVQDADVGEEGFGAGRCHVHLPQAAQAAQRVVRA